MVLRCGCRLGSVEAPPAPPDVRRTTVFARGQLCSDGGDGDGGFAAAEEGRGTRERERERSGGSLSLSLRTAAVHRPRRSATSRGSASLSSALSRFSARRRRRRVAADLHGRRRRRRYRRRWDDDDDDYDGVNDNGPKGRLRRLLVLSLLFLVDRDNGRSSSR